VDIATIAVLQTGYADRVDARPAGGKPVLNTGSPQSGPPRSTARAFESFPLGVGSGPRGYCGTVPTRSDSGWSMKPPGNPGCWLAVSICRVPTSPRVDMARIRCRRFWESAGHPVLENRRNPPARGLSPVGQRAVSPQRLCGPAELAFCVGTGIDRTGAFRRTGMAVFLCSSVNSRAWGVRRFGLPEAHGRQDRQLLRLRLARKSYLENRSWSQSATEK